MKQRGPWIARTAIWTRIFLVGFALVSICRSSCAQVSEPASTYFSRKNTFGISASYSNDSSHMLLGVSQNRKLLNFGGTYGRRLWQGSLVSWHYNAEVYPVALESDPVEREVITFITPYSGTSEHTFASDGPCHPATGTFSQTEQGVTFSYSYVTTCSRQWTVGEAMSPIGFQWTFLPRHRLQPVAIAHGGYMYSSRPIPVSSAGSFNFTFDFGVGVEIWRSTHRSFRVEYRYHHISNDFTATQNPGIDNGLFQVTYAFGK